MRKWNMWSRICGECGRHYLARATTYRILRFGNYWPSLFSNVQGKCRDLLPATNAKSSLVDRKFMPHPQSLAKLKHLSSNRAFIS